MRGDGDNFMMNGLSLSWSEEKTLSINPLIYFFTWRQFVVEVLFQYIVKKTTTFGNTVEPWALICCYKHGAWCRCILNTAGFPHRIYIFIYIYDHIPHCPITFHSIVFHLLIFRHFPLPSFFSSCIFTVPIYRLSTLQRTSCSHHPTNISLCFSYFFSSGPLHQNRLHFPLISPLLQDNDDVANWVFFLPPSCSFIHSFHVSLCLFFYICTSVFHVIAFSLSPPVLATVALSAPHPLEPLHYSVVDQVFLCLARLSR